MKLCGLQRLDTLQFQVYELKPRIRSLAQDGDLVGNGTLEFATIYRPATGGDKGSFGMQISGKFLKLGQRCQRLGKGEVLTLTPKREVIPHQGLGKALNHGRGGIGAYERRCIAGQPKT